MPPRIAIPVPHSFDAEYAGRALPAYEEAVRLAGGEPVAVGLDQDAAAVRRIAAECDGVLLPGSKADIDPARFRAERSAHTAKSDALRDSVDAELLEDAYRNGKPVLGICYGLQSLNVFRGGSLVQHIPDFLPAATRGKVNHEAGKDVAIAHSVEIEAASRLAEIVGGPRPEVRRLLSVNSSHHQSADAIGEGLRIVARCTEDGIIEAVEGTDAGQFVVAVQWHPERSVRDDEESIAIFRALIEAASRQNRG